MVRDISGLGSLTETKTRPNSGNPAAPKAAGEASPAPAAPASKQDEVALSNQAQTLQSLENKLQDVPEVNEARVAEIKQALEEGNFKIDDLVIADKLIDSDLLLGE